MDVERQTEFDVHCGAGCAMAKETKFLRKQAEKAERRARVTADAEISESLLNLAKARIAVKRTC